MRDLFPHTVPRAAAGIGAALLTRLDLEQDEYIRQMEHEFDRCRSDADLARWANTWGARAIARVRETEGLDEDAVSSEDHQKLEEEKSGLLDDFRSLNAAAADACRHVAEVLGNSTGPKTEAIQKIMADLDAARLEAEGDDIERQPPEGEE